MNCRVPWRVWLLLTRWATITFSRTLFHGVNEIYLKVQSSLSTFTYNNNSISPKNSAFDKLKEIRVISLRRCGQLRRNEITWNYGQLTDLETFYSISTTWWCGSLGSRTSWGVGFCIWATWNFCCGIYWDTVLGCIQKFPDWVENEINNKNIHSLRSNTDGYGGKAHQIDSQNSDTTAPNGTELYHLQFSL
jgi:hypothetical protein